MSEDEIREVEELVNKEIRLSLPVHTDVMNIEEAKKTGAMALFGEKYGEKVRVVSMGDFSKEFCGGTHVKNTNEIQAFKIISETGIAAGVRRIEALTGEHVFEYYRKLEKELSELSAILKTTPAEVTDRAKHLMTEVRELNSENASLKSKAAQDSLGDITSGVTEKDGIKILCRKLDDIDMNGMRDIGDTLKNKLGECVIVLASVSGGKINLMATATEGAIKKGAHAGKLISEIARIVGGGGGGRPNMAQAGGKDPSKADEALARAQTLAEGQLG